MKSRMFLKFYKRTLIDRRRYVWLSIETFRRHGPRSHGFHLNKHFLLLFNNFYHDIKVDELRRLKVEMENVLEQSGREDSSDQWEIGNGHLTHLPSCVCVCGTNDSRGRLLSR